MDKQNKQIFGGTTISYVLIAINALYGLVVTPFIVSQIGDASFGVYKAIAALSSSLMIIDLGLGGTVQRYIANYRARKEPHRIGNFVFMALFEAAILSFAALVIIIGVYYNIDTIFKQGLTNEEIRLAKQLFIILGVTIILHIFENVMNGVLTGCGCFIISNGLRLFRVLIRFCGTFFLLFLWKSPIALVVLDCALVLFLLLFECIYSKKSLFLKIHFSHFDKPVFKESLVYSLMMFLTAMASQMNGNLDNIVIGAFMTSKDVAVYSISIIIFSMFQEIACSISGLMLPKVSFLIQDGISGAKDYMISIGRIQFILIGAVFGAFIVLGKDFIHLWMGDSYMPAYYIALILMGPAILELCVNVCLSILRALNKLKFKTSVTIAMMVFNAALTIIGVKFWGYYMAAIATSMSIFLGSVLAMGLYYHKVFNFNMIKIYMSIFSRTFLCITISSIVTFLVIFIFSDSLVRLVVGSLVFITVYLLLLYYYGLNETEKEKVFSIKQHFCRR